MLFFMLAAFLPLVLACDVFLLGTATVDTSLYVNQVCLSVFYVVAPIHYIQRFQPCQRFFISNFLKNYKNFSESCRLNNRKVLYYFLSLIGVWLSLVERFVRDEEVACSNLVTPTNRTLIERSASFFIFFPASVCDPNKRIPFPLPYCRYPPP